MDLTFVPLLEKIQSELKTVKGYIIMTDDAHMPSAFVGAIAVCPLVYGFVFRPFGALRRGDDAQERHLVRVADW